MTDTPTQQIAIIMGIAAKMAATIIKGSPDPATAVMVAIETLVQVGLFTEAHGLHASADALEDRIVRHLKEAFAVRRGRQRIVEGHQPS